MGCTQDSQSIQGIQGRARCRITRTGNTPLRGRTPKPLGGFAVTAAGVMRHHANEQCGGFHVCTDTYRRADSEAAIIPC
jgi:hypothetical protein